MISFPNNSNGELLSSVYQPNTTVRVLIAEPDALSSRLMCAILEAEPDVTFQCIDNSDVIAAIQDFTPDIVIVDTQTTAIRHAANWEALGVKSPPATILTSYDRMSLLPLASAAPGFLIKPFNVEQFENAMEGARSKIEAARTSLSQFKHSNSRIGDQRKFLHRFAAESEGTIALIKVRDVLWLQSFGNYIRVHSANASHLVRTTLKNIQLLLDPTLFVRIHRNAIVNLDHVIEFFLPATGNLYVKLDNGLSLPIRRSSRKSLRKLLTQHSLL